jgi:glucose dehydrogenase
MSGFGIQKRGTGKAVKKMSLGGALAIKSGAYQGKPGTYEKSYYTESLFPQVTQAGYVPPSQTKSEKEEEKKEGMARGGDVQPPKTKKYFRPTKSGAGMTKAGVERYRRENPGSKLSTAVTGKVKPGSKSAKRRKSFCARSAGQMKMFPGAAKDPNSRLRQARRRWKC